MQTTYRTAEGHVLTCSPDWEIVWDHDQARYVRRAYTETLTNPMSGKTKRMPVGWCEEAAAAGYLTAQPGYAFTVLIPAA